MPNATHVGKTDARKISENDHSLTYVVE